MRCPSLEELPPPPHGKTGWPWTIDSISGSRATGVALPRVSIVTPSYNQGSFIEETIRSVLLQGYPDLEYFIIDGGSSDGTLDIIRKYESWLAGWISEKDHGQSGAINKGFARCTGELITFQNSDDYYLPGALLRMASAFDVSSGAIVGGFVNADAKSNVGTPVEPVLAIRTPADLSLGPPGIYRLHQVSTLFSRRALDLVGRHVDESLKYTMDRELLYRVCRHFRIVTVPDAVAAFRRHSTSKSVSLVRPFAEEFAQLYLRFQDGTEGDKARKRMANHHRAKGWITLARIASSRREALPALIKACATEPSLALRRSYVALCVKKLILSKSFR